MDCAAGSNPNLLFAETVVDALVCAGLRAACLAPGSRSTPLALAVDAHPGIEAFIHLDERSAGFFALGLAQATARPIALLSTSGTAAVEFHAAAVEALMAEIPLLLLTADRPPELRHSGANQTIDQIKMYGDHVLWSVDAALPQSGQPDVALRNLRTLAARAYATADGLRRGPVHINFPFRKPLEPRAPYRPVFEHPAGREGLRRARQTSISRGVLLPSEEQIDDLTALVSAQERGWIVCGPWPGRTPPALIEDIALLARRTGYPILADPLSGLRFGKHTACAPVIDSFENLLLHPTPFDPPEVIVRFGAVPTSKSLNDYLDRLAPPHQVQLRSSGVWADDSHRVSKFLQVDESAFCRALACRIHRPVSDWGMGVTAAGRRVFCRQAQFLQQHWFDASAIPEILDALPAGAGLFVGNSLPIRHLDQFGAPMRKLVHVYGNRGASGIDGVVSTALGVAAADRSAPLLLLIGDVSFYHDLNGLYAIGRLGLDNVTIVVLNNDGGGLFRRLPIADGHAQFERLFLTKHGLDFAPAAEMYGLDYMHHAGGDRESFASDLRASLRSGRPAIIELRTEGDRDERLRRELAASFQNRKEKNP
ncbi:MAG: 2-succinyl-5-enolpyruvyl-6-hydroxy-3-cyclohexene-1-carboxylic-acid synthase [Caldilineaceae bacterium]|nr:2-succinyl-5-enolpyruvyl-6-hydroxy-3-cyclohexene-1-carboxylic-acid synthase [Caldilineaceae bacterium]